ncbi:MAG: hypothetical protein FD123_2975 [Bacteroidetes bacterium]|nr:MAG: hypothetical protein FD123_2975 [Bacteroidota bacterium]
MKKAILFIATAAFAFNSCKKDEAPEITNVSTERKSLLIDFTATWCCPCGSSLGIYHDVLHKYPNKVITFALHASNDPFYNQDAYWHWANIYDVQGIPSYVCDNQKVLWGYVMPDLHLDTTHFHEIIHTTTAQNPPVCGIGIAKTISGSTMTIKTKTVFFGETSGNFNLGVYVVEDGLVYTQNCSDDSTHNSVFRECVTDADGAGILLSSGAVSKGKTFDKTFTYNIPSGYVANNLHVIAVIYKMGSDPKPLEILNVNRN